MTIDIAEPADRSIVESAVVSYLAGYRGETVRAYAGDLRSWTEWCATSGIAPLAVTRAQIETYARTLQGRSWTTASHRRPPGNHGLLLLPALRR